MKLNASGVGIRIQQARKAKGWTQGDLAKVLKVQRSSVVRWETGQGVPKSIPKLAKALNQTAAWLLDRAGEGNLEISPVAFQLKEIRQMKSEIRRLNKKLVEQNSKKSQAKIKSEPEGYKGAQVLEDILKSWNRANEESRLVAALLLTGDWSYKLKLINRDIAIDDEVLKAIRLKKS